MPHRGYQKLKNREDIIEYHRIMNKNTNHFYAFRLKESGSRVNIFTDFFLLVILANMHLSCFMYQGCCLYFVKLVVYFMFFPLRFFYYFYRVINDWIVQPLLNCCMKCCSCCAGCMQSFHCDTCWLFMYYSNPDLLINCCNTCCMAVDLNCF